MEDNLSDNENMLQTQVDEETNVNDSDDNEVYNDISEGVLEYSNKVNADLIIIMTQKELEWSKFIIGTESQQIINNSDIPVCSIRPTEKRDMTEYVIQ